MSDCTQEQDSRADEAAAAKLWAVYVSEAEKYDKGLVESWRSDMEGMLIFAGLFSASLTAFLIESYKTLIPDSGDTTVFLLAQISQQLSASATGTPFSITPPAPFHPPASSIACNLLWFISLGLSLTCALVATLVEQWARDFLHRADMRSAPVIRARIFSFLYYGLKRFEMHTVVEIIPLLLHTSLLLFFAGLVAFLIPVNKIMATLAGIILGVVVAVYAILTLLPVYHLDCPYRTPLSGIFWHIHQLATSISNRWRSVSELRPSLRERRKETMVESVFRKATENSKERSTRDTKSLLWTLKSLTDDVELEPFVEAIPLIIWGTDSLSGADERRYVYDDRIRPLMENPEVQLLPRIESLLESCDTGLLTLEVSKRRRISCYKAVWALSSLAIPGASVHHMPYYTSRAEYLQTKDPEAVPYAVSATAMQQWANFHSAQSFDDILKLLNQCRDDVLANRTPNLTLLRSYLWTLNWKYHTHLDTHVEVHSSVGSAMDSLLLVIETLLEEVGGLSFTIPFRLALEYIDEAQASSVIPYQFTTTYALIAPKTQTPLSVTWLERLQLSLDHLVSKHVALFRSNEAEHWLDEAFRQILSFWYPIADAEDSLPLLPWAVIEYLNRRKCEEAVQMAVRSLPIGAWQCFAETIHKGPAILSGFYVHDPAPSLSDSLITAWKLYFWSPQWPADLPTLEAILDAVSKREFPSISPSVIAMARRAILVELAWGYGHPPLEDLISRSQHGIFPSVTSSPHVDSAEEEMTEKQARRVLRHRGIEGMLNTLSELMECCCTSTLPFKATETMQRVGSFVPQSTVHSTHELRFATAVKKLFTASLEYSDRAELLNTVLNLNCFDGYAPAGHSGVLHGWLENPEARDILKSTFTTYLTRSSPPDNPRNFTRLQTIVAHLDILHPNRSKTVAGFNRFEPRTPDIETQDCLRTESVAWRDITR